LSVFRSDVRRAGGETEERVYGTTVYDRTAMSARKDRPCLVLQTQKGALQVRVENSLPFLLGCTSAASVADKHMLPDLLHGEERKVWGDGAYQGQGEAIRTFCTDDHAGGQDPERLTAIWIAILRVVAQVLLDRLKDVSLQGYPRPFQTYRNRLSCSPIRLPR